MIRISDGTIAETIDLKFMGDASMFLDTARLFLSDQEERLEGIQRALQARDFGRVRELVHSFKSSLSYFHLKTPVELAEKIESQAVTRDPGGLEELSAQFGEQVRRLAAELRELLSVKSGGAS